MPEGESQRSLADRDYHSMRRLTVDELLLPLLPLQLRHTRFKFSLLHRILLKLLHVLQNQVEKTPPHFLSLPLRNLARVKLPSFPFPIPRILNRMRNTVCRYAILDGVMGAIGRYVAFHCHRPAVAVGSGERSIGASVFVEAGGNVIHNLFRDDFIIGYDGVLFERPCDNNVVGWVDVIEVDVGIVNSLSTPDLLSE